MLNHKHHKLVLLLKTTIDSYLILNSKIRSRIFKQALVSSQSISFSDPPNYFLHTYLRIYIITIDPSDLEAKD